MTVLSVIVVENPSLRVVREQVTAGLRTAGADVTWMESWPALLASQRDLARMDVLVGAGTCPIFSQLIAAAPRLRAAIAVGSGIEGFDRAIARRHAIIIGNGANPENSESMAEATILLMLALLYRLHESEDILRTGRPSPVAASARSVRHRTVGLIGYGRIGRAVARKLSTWDAHIQVYGPRLNTATLSSEVTAVDLHTLLQTSDIVSLHVALNDETRGLLGADRLRLMKRGALLINTARGGIIDEAALIELLKDGHLAGAALDVFATEPLPADSALRNAPNIILTPHRIGHTRDGHEGLARTAIENVAHVIGGEPPLYTCNPEIIAAWRAKWVDRAATRAV